MSTKARKESKISRYIKAPVRALGKARDFYVRSFSNCAGKVGYGGVAAYAAGPQMPPLPRSFSVNSSASSNDEDFRELIRASSSTRSLGNKLDLEILIKQQQVKQSPVGGVSVVPRSKTVTVWRIDEDKGCEFGDFKVNTDVIPRSRSYAVSRRSRKL